MTLRFPTLTAPGDVVEVCELQAALTIQPKGNASTPVTPDGGGGGGGGGGGDASGGGLSGGAIAGIVIGSLLAAALLLLLVTYLRWRGRWLAQQRLQEAAVAPAAKEDPAAAAGWEVHGYGGSDEEGGLGSSGSNGAAPAGAARRGSGEGGAAAAAAAAAVAGAAAGAAVSARPSPASAAADGADPETGLAVAAAVGARGQGEPQPPPPRVSELELLRQFLRTLRPGRHMVSLSQKSSEESRSRRRAGFRVVRGGAAGSGIDTDVVTDLTKLPAGFLEGAPRPGRVPHASPARWACPPACMGRWARAGEVAGGRCWRSRQRRASASGAAGWMLTDPRPRPHRCPAPPPFRSVARRHPPGGVRGRGLVRRGAAPARAAGWRGGGCGHVCAAARHGRCVRTRAGRVPSRCRSGYPQPCAPLAATDCCARMRLPWLPRRLHRPQVWLAEFCGALVAVKILAKVRLRAWACHTPLSPPIARRCTCTPPARSHPWRTTRESLRSPCMCASVPRPSPAPPAQVKSDFMTHSMQQQLALRNLKKEALLMSKLRHPNGAPGRGCGGGAPPGPAGLGRAGPAR